MIDWLLPLVWVTAFVVTMTLGIALALWACHLEEPGAVS